MDIQTYVKTNLQACNLAALKDCAIGSGIPYNTLIRIKYNDVNPRVDTVQPIYNYFKAKEAA